MTEQQKKHPLYKFLMELKPYRVQFRLSADGMGLELITPEPLPERLKDKLARFEGAIIAGLKMPKKPKGV
jgi:hypothetical protein